MFRGALIEKALWSTLDDMLEYFTFNEWKEIEAVYKLPRISVLVLYSWPSKLQSMAFPVVCKLEIHKRFSNLSIEQIYGQENCKIKSKGGIIGLSDNPSSLQKWMFCVV